MKQGWSVDVEKFLRDLEIIVNIDSGQGNPKGIREVGYFFAERLRRKEWIIEEHDFSPHTGSCFIIKNHLVSNYDLMLVGHLDTVFPPGEVDKRPFSRDAKKAYGVGVLDMKQGCLAMLYALEALPKEILDTLNIVIILNPDEEIGSLYSSEILADYAKITDMAFVFEAALHDGSLCIQRKGISSFVVDFYGKSGHAGYIFDGGMYSAVEELIYWAWHLKELHSEVKGTSVNIGLVEGGLSSNIVAEKALMKFEVRYEEIEEYKVLKILLEKMIKHASESRVEVNLIEKSVPPLIPKKKTLDYTKKMKRIAKEIGVPFKMKKRGGVSDANLIASYGPICIDGLGPYGNYDHSEKEFVYISSIAPSIRLITSLIYDLAKEKSEGKP